ncbi:MAG: hypothetical protein A2W01_00300 [Candidatus Solincola sediminis]|uniref:SnoaL-like domain-containing protein n=1 Tax=Candidatus Solincola sediminis TaxID=1797199 RepID=A0A1F2WHQ2_9ACTN|nr:MAG: hypothetical protein A2Y75_03955 [Candidatus Solincola sediminis]OFW61711.1 MAG: hypothetical protein A2W01_00300 [Candidatus Solincola sediminis]
MRTSFKLAFAIVLALVAGFIGYTRIVRIQPAQSTVLKAFDRLEEGDLEGAMQYVDPQGQLRTFWDENERARDELQSFMQRNRLDFSSLKFSTKIEKDNAEVELKGGDLAVYSREGNDLPQAVLDLKGVNLVFYVEKREGQWLIEGINYDLSQMPQQGQFLLPF